MTENQPETPQKIAANSYTLKESEQQTARNYMSNRLQNRNLIYEQRREIERAKAELARAEENLENLEKQDALITAQIIGMANTIAFMRDDAQPQGFMVSDDGAQIVRMGR